MLEGNSKGAEVMTGGEGDPTVDGRVGIIEDGFELLLCAGSADGWGDGVRESPFPSTLPPSRSPTARDSEGRPRYLSASASEGEGEGNGGGPEAER